MPRSPKSPEGPRQNITIRLPRKHLDVLDETGAKIGQSRSDIIISLIERLKGFR